MGFCSIDVSHDSRESCAGRLCGTFAFFAAFAVNFEPYKSAKIARAGTGSWVRVIQAEDKTNLAVTYVPFFQFKAPLCFPHELLGRDRQEIHLHAM